MKTNIFCVVAIFITIAWHSQNFAESQDNQLQAALEQAVNQLSNKTYIYKGPETNNIKSLFVTWKNARTEKNLENLTDEIYQVSQNSRTISVVTISATGGEDAMIKYQTYGQRRRGEKEKSTAGLTTTTENMYMGLYYIWSERNGARTSDQNRLITITSTTAAVKLQEGK